eukprot:1847800-Amphidinium_carterae.1
MAIQEVREIDRALFWVIAHWSVEVPHVRSALYVGVQHLAAAVRLGQYPPCCDGSTQLHHTACKDAPCGIGTLLLSQGALAKSPPLTTITVNQRS